MTDQPRGPIDWARHQQAEREARQTVTPAATEATGDPTATELLRCYRDWLAAQHTRAVRADQAGEVPDHLKISPHNGIASGLHTALLGLGRLLADHDAGPTVREAAADDRAYWERRYAGEQL